MKILCLILASDTAPEYIQFQKCWKRMMKINSNVDCYFYKGHPDLTQPAFLEDDTLWIRVPETLDTVYEKTLRAFEYFVPQLDKYDFVFRSNLSTFLSFPHLLEYCTTLPKSECCAAVVGGIPPEEEGENSINTGFSFPGGNGFLLSTDLVRRLVEERIPLVAQDDVTIGVALRKWNVPIQEFVRPDFLADGVWYVNNYQLLQPNERNLNPTLRKFSYRIKSNDRKKDVEVMSALIRKHYNV